MEKQSPLLRLWELGKDDHGGLVGAICSASIGVLCGMLPYFAAAQIIIGFLNGNKEISFYVLWCVLALAGFFVRSALYSLALSLSHRSTFSILKSIRERILEKLPRMPLGTVMDTPSGQMKQIIVDQVESMERPLAHLLPEMTANILGPVCILIYLFVLDWRMALLSLVSIPVGMIFMMAVMKNYGTQYEGSVKVTQAMNSTIVEYIGGIEVIKAFNQGKNSYARFTDRVKANASYFYHWMKSCQMPMSGAGHLPHHHDHHFTGGLAALCPEACLLGPSSPPLSCPWDRRPTAGGHGLCGQPGKGGYHCGRSGFHSEREEQDHGDNMVKLGSMDVQVEHVSFGYHDDKEILHDISLSIPAGSMTAFVGPSGSGKSTIAKLIGGFWDVDKGKITLGGQDLKEIPLSQLYDQVAFVSQDNYLFDETVRENIRMGKPSASDAEVEAVAKAAGCDGFIRSLENGYDTVVGGGGAHLSGGERQRISIARAMLKNAPIVILDEATAYIDPENEAVIQQAVARLVKGKTVIVIAHRLSTITDADQIFVIQDGRVAGNGTHKELLEQNRLYQEMWNAHIGAKDGDAA